VTTDIVKIKPKPEGLDKPYVPKIIKVMSQVNTAVYRWTGGLLGSTWRVGSAFPWGIPVLLLTTIGRKSGQPRTLPLLFIEEGDHIIIVASRGGLPSEPLWYKNLVANPECDVQIKRRKFKAKARTASPDERETLWPKLVAHYPDFASYATWTDRIIPVVILEPIG
jgi:deazaflavin-dependent oxidoreductase (nitroreductase family)